MTRLNRASVARGRFAVTSHGSVAGRDRGWHRLEVEPGEASKDFTQIKQGFSGLHGKEWRRSPRAFDPPPREAPRSLTFPCNLLNPCLIRVKSLLAVPRTKGVT